METITSAQPEEIKEDKNPFAGQHDGSVFNAMGHFDHTKLDDLLIWATDKKASDITIQTNLEVMADIGGGIHRITDVKTSKADVDGIVRYIYGENGPAEILGGGDLDPSHEIRIKGVGMKRYRVNVTGGRIPGGEGMQITLRTLPENPIHISKLGIEEDITKNFRPEQGLILVTGPTGSGKSTLLSSGLRMLVENPDGNEKVLEYSSPIEYVYDGIVMPSSLVFQTHAGVHLRPRGEETEESIFALCVRNALRRKPTIIVIGEARDKATIEATTEAALTGHLVFSTMHTIGVGPTLRRAVMPFPESTRAAMAIDIMESLRMIVTQLLIPKKGGGKVGCREYMVFDEGTRESFLRENIDTWPRHARKLLASQAAVGKTMIDSSLDLLKQDLITEETFERVAAKGKV